MKSPEKPKVDYFGLIKTLLFPKKGAPVPKPAAATPANEPAPLVSAAPASPKAEPKPGEKKSFQLNWSKIGPAFWTITGILSLIVNVILIAVLVVVGTELFTIKRMVGHDLLGGLYVNFIKMDQATIKADVPVNTSIHLLTDTVVVLTEQTTLQNARVTLNTGGLNITNAPATVVLQPGTELPVKLDLQVPININVAVDIPLENTELHEPFVGLQNVVAPYYWLLMPEIKNWQDVPLCQGWAAGLCDAYFK